MANIQDVIAFQQQMLNGADKSTKEQFKTKLRANICWAKPADNEKGYTPISLPFGIQLELPKELRSRQMPESLALMDGLAEIAKSLDEGTSLDLNVEIGGFFIQLRHSGEAQEKEAPQALVEALSKIKLQK